MRETEPGVTAAEVVRSAGTALDAILARTEEICAIPAPTFHEEKRAAYVQRHFEAQNLPTWSDAAGNVFARLAGSGGGAVLLAAHTDTVFPADTPLDPHVVGDRLVGPGIGDNSLSVAVLLALPDFLRTAGLRPVADLILCANVGEEGLGNLRGIRQAIDDLGPQISGVVAVEGHGLGRITNRAVGSLRLRIEVEGPGGHSWGAFGGASAIHVLGDIIAGITHLPVPTDPKTTFNVGLIEGGVSVNTIAPHASLTLDLRSADPAALSDLAARVTDVVDGIGAAEPRVEIRTTVIGDRPAGGTPEDSQIVQTSIAVLGELGIEAKLGAGSTDANIPMAAGIPAVCIGLTRGGNSHRTDEYIEIEPIATGLAQLALLVTRLGGQAQAG